MTDKIQQVYYFDKFEFMVLLSACKIENTFSFSLLTGDIEENDVIYALQRLTRQGTVEVIDRKIRIQKELTSYFEGIQKARAVITVEPDSHMGPVRICYIGQNEELITIEAVHQDQCDGVRVKKEKKTGLAPGLAALAGVTGETILTDGEAAWLEKRDTRLLQEMEEIRQIFGGWEDQENQGEISRACEFWKMPIVLKKIDLIEKKVCKRIVLVQSGASSYILVQWNTGNQVLLFTEERWRAQVGSLMEEWTNDIS